MNFRILFCALCLCFVGAIAAAQEKTTPAIKQTTPPAPAPPPAPNTGDPVVARVLGEPITEKEVLGVINQIASQQPISADQMQNRNTLFYKEALENLVSQTLLKHEGQEMKIDVDPGKVDEQYKGLASRFPNEEQFRQAIQKQGFTDADVRRTIRDSLMLQQVIADTVKDVPAPTEPEMKKFYDENPKYFEQPEQVHAAHILLRVDPKATPEQKAEIRKKIEALRSDIENKKITFTDAAKQNSQDPGSAPKGGDLGFFGRDQMVKPFADAAFTAKPGTLSPVVETQFGYHLIQVIETRPPGKKDYESSKKDIAAFLDRKAKEQALQKHIEALKAKSPVEKLMTDDEWNRRNGRK